jgi:hypothetical protein
MGQVMRRTALDRLGCNYVSLLEFAGTKLGELGELGCTHNDEETSTALVQRWHQSQFAVTISRY